MTSNVLITGSSTGFGRDAAERLARRGHRVSRRCATSMAETPAIASHWRVSPRVKGCHCACSSWTSGATSR